MEHQVLTPYLSATNAAEAIDFYKKVFGVEEVGARIADGNGVIGHATLKIGDSTFYISEESANPNLNRYVKSPQTLQSSSVILSLIVDDVDAILKLAEEEGATVVIPPSDQFYGHRSGRIVDPFGHVWIIGTVIEEVSDEELLQRAEEFYKNN